MLCLFTAGSWSLVTHPLHAACCRKEGKECPRTVLRHGEAALCCTHHGGCIKPGIFILTPSPWMHPAISHLPFSEVYQRSQALPTSTLLPALKAASPGQNPPFFPCTAAGTAEAHAAGKGAAIPACHPDPSQGLRHSSTSSKL